MKTWFWGSAGLSLVVLAASCAIKTGDGDGEGGAGGEVTGGSGGSTQGGAGATAGSGGKAGGGSSSEGGAAGDGPTATGGTDGGGAGGGEGGQGGAGDALDFTPTNVPGTSVGAGSTGELILGGATCSYTTVDINTDTGEIDGCSLKLGTDYAFAQVEQSDGSRVGVFMANRVRIEQTITAVVDGQLPLVIVARDTLQVVGKLNATAALSRAVGGGFTGVVNVSNTPGNGPGGGGAGSPAGGGSYCGKGGRSTTTTAGGAPYSNPEIVPLIGGSSGGATGIWDSGAGGGAIQLVAGTSIQIATTGVINVGGGGGGQGSNAGGSGGAILLEAPVVTVAGILAANGGGGGTGSGATKGQNGLPSVEPAAGAGPEAQGGDGSSAESIDGEPGLITDNKQGGGGGGAGVIRINTASGAATITGKLSPSLDTPCATQGELK
jgi:hypothetical protein